MLAVVVAAAVAVLPPQGLVTRAATGVVLVDVHGHVLRRGIYLFDPRSRHAAFVYRGHGRLWGSAFAR
jgi:hypothetical protein